MCAAIVFSFFMLCAGNAYASDIDALLDKLIEKGVIDESEAQEIRNETQKAIDEQKAAEKEMASKEAKEKGPFYVKFSKGELKLGGYIQARFEHFKKPSKVDTFRVKSAVIALNGKIKDSLLYKYEMDFARKDNVLNEAWIKFARIPTANLTVGQFKLPFSEEFITSSSAIDTVERSLPVTKIGQERDAGLMLDGTSMQKKLYYALGIFNGTGQNTAEDNEQKDAAFRLVFAPFADLVETNFKAFQVGGSFTLGKQTTGDAAYDRKRIGLLLKVETQKIKFQSEYLRQTKDFDLATATDTSSSGFYGLIAYSITREGKKMWWQPVLKYETYEPDSTKASDEEAITTLGLNVFFNDTSKLMLNYRLRDDDAGKEKYDEFLTQAQLKF